MLSCGCRFDEDEDELDDLDDLDDLLDGFGPDDEPFGVDGNGLLTERRTIGGVDVILHYDDVPDTDVTEVDGIRCTTALRTVIDVAPEMTLHDLRSTVAECFERGLFTAAEAWRRLDCPDMADRRGAELLRRVLPPCER
jgi:hypothetical protein